MWGEIPRSSCSSCQLLLRLVSVRLLMLLPPVASSPATSDPGAESADDTAGCSAKSDLSLGNCCPRDGELCASPSLVPVLLSVAPRRC
eukprot:COSAG05_NODE_502_length_9214_cov_3.816676_10_plen_87_part_01